MFGYVTICKPELKVKEFYEFRAFYCGLCRTLKSKYGIPGQMTLTYDMTFLVMLLTSLYECPTAEEHHHCMVHPVKKHAMLQNEITDYCASMNVALSWYHLKDDWEDERKPLGLAGMQVFRRNCRKVEREYPRQCQVMREELANLRDIEKAASGKVSGKRERFENRKNPESSQIAESPELTGSRNAGMLPDLDAVSDCFGRLMAELFVWKQDQWEEALRKIGFYLGKFIYLMDAYDDLAKDEKSGSFNPLLARKGEPDFEDRVREMLVMMMAECTNVFERLPLIKDVDILRNILYNGVWTRYEKLQRERKQDL